jgi:glutathione S-transferase
MTMSGIVLWRPDVSTYVRTVKMVLAEKGVSDFKQVPLNVLAGEPKTPEHLARHPFGKVPVLDHDGMRILETTALFNVPGFADWWTKMQAMPSYKDTQPNLG